MQLSSGWEGGVLVDQSISTVSVKTPSFTWKRTGTSDQAPGRLSRGAALDSKQPQTLAPPIRLGLLSVVNWVIITIMNAGTVVAALLFVTASVARAQTNAPPAIVDFFNATAGQYQVVAQSSGDVAWQVNRFMNQMLQQYSRYFSNWSLKAGARVIVFSNAEDFRAYAVVPAMLVHGGLAGYCHLNTDEDGNTFYELVTHEHDNLWQVLAHEGFHQFLGYELGLEVPVWLNEGMAQYFETSYIAYGRLHTGLVSQSKLRVAQELCRTGRALSVSELLQMDRTTFYANARVTYPMSWALVYYLMTRDGSSYSNSRFRHYLQDLKFNQDSIASFQRRFGRDSSQWESDFVHYILRLQPPSQ